MIRKQLKFTTDSWQDLLGKFVIVVFIKAGTND